MNTCHRRTDLTAASLIDPAWYIGFISDGAVAGKKCDCCGINLSMVNTTERLRRKVGSTPTAENSGFFGKDNYRSRTGEPVVIASSTFNIIKERPPHLSIAASAS